MTGNWNIHVHGLTKSLDSFDTDYKFIVAADKEMFIDEKELIENETY